MPSFSYNTMQGQVVSKANLKGKTSMIILGHITCPALLILLKDIQKANIDTVQYLLFLENTNAQIVRYNSADTTDNIWSQFRMAFKADTLQLPTAAVCEKEHLAKKANGMVVIKNQCNKLKFKFRAYSSPTIFVTNDNGEIIAKQKGWFTNVEDPQATLLRLLQGNKLE
jgi:hypothetical protein